MSNGTFRGRWVDEVFKTPRVSAEVKVFLLFLANYHMGDGGRVSEPRESLASQLGCHPRNVTAKFRAAIGAGLMEQTARGQKHRTAEYRAVVPQPSQGDDNYHPEDDSQGAGFYHPETAQGAGFYHPEDDSQGDDSHHPTTKRDGKVSDHAQASKTVPLFDDEEQNPPPAGTTKPSADKQLTPVQIVVAAYIEGVQEATGERPDGRTIGRISQQAKDLIKKDRRNQERLVDAARALGLKIGKGYLDLGQEYMMAAAATQQPNGNSRGGVFENVNGHDWSGWESKTSGGNRR